MKQGQSLTDLAATVERIANTKRDFIVPTARLSMRADTPEYRDDSEPSIRPGLRLVMRNGHDEPFRIRETAHRQIGDRLSIPVKYYDRMRTDAPALLAENVNHWLQAEPKKQLLRTLDGAARAFLSDRYRIIDNYDVAEIAIRAFQSVGHMEIASCCVTETRMYIKARFPGIRREVRRGDIIESGVSITNSEVGLGALGVKPFLTRLECENGMTMDVGGIRKAHLGRQSGSDESIVHLLSDETITADNKVLMMKVRDVVGTLASAENFGKIVEMMQASAEQPIDGDVREVVEVARDRFGLTEDETGSVLKHLIAGGDLTQWGLANAVTRASADIPSYDRATELEEIGGKIVELRSNEWQRLDKAA